MIVIPIIKNSRPEIRDNDLDGVVQLQDLTGQAQLRDNPLDSDLYAPADGDNYSEAGGIKRMFANRRAIRKEKLAQKRLTKQSKADARKMRADAQQTKAKAKVLASKAQQEAAKGLSKQDDSAVIAALQQSQSTTTPENTGLTKGQKIGIGVGIGVVLLIVGVVAYKKLKGK